MKRAKRIYILLIVLAAVIVAIVVVSRVQRRVEKIQSTNEVILDIDSDDVTALSWDAEDEYSYAFTYDDGWYWDEDENFPVSETAIKSLLRTFSNFEADFAIEDVSDYGQYGLDNPVATIDITTNDETYEITLGDYSVMDQERYLCINGGDVYVVSEDPLENFEVELADLIENDSLRGLAKADTITFTGEENYTIYYEEDSEYTYYPEDVYFIEGSNLPLATSKVETYLSNIGVSTLSDYATYCASEEEMELYGFNDPYLTVTVEYPDTDEDDNEITSTLTFSIGENQEDLASLAAAGEDADEAEDADSEEEVEVSRYLRVGDSQIIYNLSNSDFSRLSAASYDDLRHSTVLTVDFADVNQIDIALDGEVYSIYEQTGSGDDDEESTVRHFYYYYDGVPVSEADLEEGEDIEDYRNKIDSEELSNYVDAITAESFTDEEPSGQEEIALTVYLDNDRYPQVTMTIYRYDADYCLATLDGEPVAFVERAAVVDLIEEVYSIVL